MKTKILIGLISIFMGCLNLFAQQTIVVTTQTDKTDKIGYSYKTTAIINHPELNGNPRAIITIAGLVDNFGTPYPHPLAAWYAPDDKWHIYNVNQARMEKDKLFEVKFWKVPDANHFVHRVTKVDLERNPGKSRIDNPALDNHPDAYFQVFPMSSANSDTINDNSPYPKYDEREGKWYIESINGKQIYAYNAFNIVIQNSGTPGMIRPDSNLGGTNNPNLQNSSPPNSSTSTTGGSGIETFFKINPVPLSPSFPKEILTDKLPSLGQTIVVKKKSRMIIDASILVSSSCTNCSGFFRVKINGKIEESSYTTFSLTTSNSISVIINSYMVDLSPGTYGIEFEVLRFNSNFQIFPQRSSIILLPID